MPGLGQGSGPGALRHSPSRRLYKPEAKIIELLFIIAFFLFCLWVLVPLAQTWFISLVVLPHVTYMVYMFHKINQSCRTRAGFVAE